MFIWWETDAGGQLGIHVEALESVFLIEDTEQITFFAHGKQYFVPVNDDNIDAMRKWDDTHK